VPSQNWPASFAKSTSSHPSAAGRHGSGHRARDALSCGRAMDRLRSAGAATARGARLAGAEGSETVDSSASPARPSVSRTRSGSGPRLPKGTCNGVRVMVEAEGGAGLARALQMTVAPLQMRACPAHRLDHSKRWIVQIRLAKRAFQSASSYSPAAVLSWTMPPPTFNTTSPPSNRLSVLMATLNSDRPSGAAQPIAPQ
jgi:hypothetical protein